jgi:head-tail adaptor
MIAGKLRHKVALYTPTSAVSAMGEIETSAGLVGTFYADVRSMPKGEVNDQGTLVSTTAYKIILRYNTTALTDISPASYFLFEGKKLLVRSVAYRDHRNRVLEITAEASR